MDNGNLKLFGPLFQLFQPVFLDGSFLFLFG